MKLIFNNVIRTFLSVNTREPLYCVNPCIRNFRDSNKCVQKYCLYLVLNSLFYHTGLCDVSYPLDCLIIALFVHFQESYMQT